MKIGTRQVDKFLKKPPDKINAVLFHGNDAGLRSIRSNRLASLYNDNLDDVFGVTLINGSSLTGQSSIIADAADEISMFGKRLVMVKASGAELLNACKILLSRPICNAMVIVNASDTNTKHAIVKLFETTDTAAAIGCYPDDESSIRQLAQALFRQDNISVDPDALDIICSRLGNDHAATRSELEKLALLAGHRGHLDRETVSEALGDSALMAIDAVANAIANGHVFALSAALQKAWTEEANCIMIIRGCQTYFNQLRILSHAISTRQSAKSAVQSLRPPVHFKLQDALIQNAKRWQPQRCIDMVNRLQNIEINIKSKMIYDRTLTAQSLLGLCLRSQ